MRLLLKWLTTSLWARSRFCKEWRPVCPLRLLAATFREIRSRRRFTRLARVTSLEGILWGSLGSGRGDLNS